MTELNVYHRQANRLHLAMLDMQDVRRYLDAYTELETQGEGLTVEFCQTLRETLIIAAIVAYCRPFKKSRSQGQALENLSLEKFWWINNNAAQMALHALIATKRDKFVAHSDWSARSTEIVELTPTGVERKFSDPDLMERLNPKEFSALALAVEKDCYYQAMALQYRMHKEEHQLV